MTLEEFIEREIRLVRESSRPNVVSIRFVQLHEQKNRNKIEEEEYQTLYALMRTRWRWQTGMKQILDHRKDEGKS